MRSRVTRHAPRTPLCLLMTALTLLGACGTPGASNGAATDAANGAAANGAVIDPENPLARPVAAWPTNVPRADTLSDTPENVRIRRGLALLTGTRDSLPQHVGNGLRCVTCHLEDGRRADALPWVGLVSRFPQYRTRNAFMNQLEDRINDCFERSLAGSALAHDSPELRDMMAYFQFLSRGVPPGHRIAGQGAPRLELTEGDLDRGADVYDASCARCHGVDGAGTPLATPLWGTESYSIGAGMARPHTAAAFIRKNMPYDNPSLTDQQALDVATYINAQPRPGFARTREDWPFGGAPADVPYETATVSRMP